jgi:undecaprenyl-diphosphatase
MSAAESATVDRGPAGRRPVVAGLAAAAVLGILVTALVTGGDGAPTALDESVQDFTRSWADGAGFVLAVADVLARATAPVLSAVYAVALFAVLLATRHRAAAFFLAIATAAAMSVYEVVKHIVARQRPPTADRYISTDALDESFPSGHTTAGIALFLVLGLILWQIGRAEHRPWLVRAGIGFVVFGPVLGLSRVVLGVHWATDVLAGWALGSTAACAVALLLWHPLARQWRARPVDAPHPDRAA